MHPLFATVLYLWSSFWANPAQLVYPPSNIGVTKNIFVGKLNCAARLNDIEHFQHWCIKNNKVTQNQVIDIKNWKVVYTDVIDDTPLEEYARITWFVAYVEGNPNTVAYQVAYTIGDQLTRTLYGQF